MEMEHVVVGHDEETGEVLRDYRPVKENKKLDTWSVKMEPALKQELQQFLAEEEGVKAQDFIRKAYNLYKTNKVIEGENLLSAEAKEVQAISERLASILVNANSKINTHIGKIYTDAQADSATKDKYIGKLEEDLEGIKSSLKETEEKLALETKEKNEYVARTMELEKTTAKATQEADIAKEQVVTLTNTIKSLEEDREENKHLKEQLKNVYEEQEKEIDSFKNRLNEKELMIVTLEKEVANKDAEIKELNKEHTRELADVQKNNERNIEDLKKDHVREVESLAEKAEAKLQKEKMQLENDLTRTHMKTVNELEQALKEAETVKMQEVLKVKEECNKQVEALRLEILELKTKLAEQSASKK